jgi:hypothetical protein
MSRKYLSPYEIRLYDEKCGEVVGDVGDFYVEII